MVRVGILGASGYGGAELLRLLKAHPEVELVGFSSLKYEGRPLEAAWPQLWDGRLFAAQEEVLERAEVVFLALPNGLSMEIAPEALKAGKRVVDLSGDFRLPPEVYEAWYRIPHKSPDLYREAVYGLPELHREELKGARLVANPGCYVTAATLALAPLAAEGVLKGAFVVGLSGVTLAGFFIVPIAALIQHRPDYKEKGAVIAASGSSDCGELNSLASPPCRPALARASGAHSGSSR